MRNKDKKVGFEFVQHGKYPIFIKDHPFFQQTKTGSADNKIFPHIGLPNSIENCNYINVDIDNYALNALCGVVRELEEKKNYQSTEINDLILSLNKVIQVNLTNNITRAADGKLELRLPQDVFVHDKLVYKKGKSIFKIYTSLQEMCKKSSYPLFNLDDFAAIKYFNSINIPSSGMKIAFSSSGEDGYWDLATISMRGIASCQAWDKPQAPALVSCLSSRFTGVIYITNDEPFNAYGSRMLRRAVVRYCIHKTNGAPALVMDNIYPSWDIGSMNLFKDFLNKKTGLPVLAPGCAEDLIKRSSYLIPQERTWEKYPLKPIECFYMDSPISYKKDVVVPRASINEIITTDQRIHAKVREFIKNYSISELESEKFLNDRKRIIHRIMDYELNLLYLIHSSKRSVNISQIDFNRQILRDVLVNYKTYYDQRIIKSFFVNHVYNLFYMLIAEDLKSELKKIIYMEYKKII